MVPSNGRKAKLLIAYYSYTGTTRSVAQSLAERLREFFDIEIVEIAPTRARCYVHWLAYSFIPGAEVEIVTPEMELSKFDVVLLGFPKWTFSCPPLNRFVHKLKSLDKPRFYLFMTCGGFDDQRFLGNVTRKLAKTGCNVAGSLTIERKMIQRGTYRSSIDTFVKHVHEEHEAHR